jgi:hypothetical protein
MKPSIQTTKQGIFLLKGSTRLKAETSTPYLKGFEDAFKRGVEKNSYATDAYRYLYRIGYDAGITEYCRINHPEEFAQ